MKQLDRPKHQMRLRVGAYRKSDLGLPQKALGILVSLEPQSCIGLMYFADTIEDQYRLASKAIEQASGGECFLANIFSEEFWARHKEISDRVMSESPKDHLWVTPDQHGMYVRGYFFQSTKHPGRDCEFFDTEDPAMAK